VSHWCSSWILHLLLRLYAKAPTFTKSSPRFSSAFCHNANWKKINTALNWQTTTTTSSTRKSTGKGHTFTNILTQTRNGRTKDTHLRTSIGAVLVLFSGSLPFRTMMCRRWCLLWLLFPPASTSLFLRFFPLKTKPSLFTSLHDWFCSFFSNHPHVTPFCGEIKFKKLHCCAFDTCPGVKSELREGSQNNVFVWKMCISVTPKILLRCQT